ncbi:MAG: stage III sporulation protein AE [Turicibacter sp.]|nr:stage III sporulation protein AE [Turicibacter sp.]
MNPMSNIDLSAFEEIWGQLYQDYSWLIQADYLDRSNLLNMESFSIVGFFQSLMSYALYEVGQTFQQFRTVLLFLLVVALFQNLQSSISNRHEKTTNMIIKIVLMVQLFQIFIFYHDSTLAVLTRYMDIVVAIFPIMISLITLTGALWNQALFQPAIVFLINASYFFFRMVSLPLTVVGTVMGFVDRIGPQSLYSRLTELVNKLAVWSMGGYFAFFLTLLSFQNITMSFSNGLFFRTTQSLLNHVPIIGSRVTDTLVSVGAALSIMRNSVGLLSVITLGIFISFPIIKLAIGVVLFKLLSAVLQPLLGKEFIGIMDVFNTGIMNLLVIMVIIGIMFIFTFFMFLYSSNLMLR